jgi:hypothetical protein
MLLSGLRPIGWIYVHADASNREQAAPPMHREKKAIIHPLATDLLPPAAGLYQIKHFIPNQTSGRLIVWCPFSGSSLTHVVRGRWLPFACSSEWPHEIGFGIIAACVVVTMIPVLNNAIACNIARSSRREISVWWRVVWFVYFHLFFDIGNILISRDTNYTYLCNNAIPCWSYIFHFTET